MGKMLCNENGVIYNKFEICLGNDSHDYVILLCFVTSMYLVLSKLTVFMVSLNLNVITIVLNHSLPHVSSIILTNLVIQRSH